MPELVVGAPKLQADGNSQTLSASFSVQGKTEQVWFRTGPGPLNVSPEPFLPVALIPAMRRHWPLRMAGAISPELLAGANRIQQVMSGWYRKFRKVGIRVSSAPPGPPGKAVAAFFSGGVDSFFTLLRHRAEITHLVLIHGFDMRLQDTARRAEGSANARRAAERLGLELVEVETNLRDFGDAHVSWRKAYFGAGLAAVALLLSPRFRRIYLPASIATEHLFPVGSHPDLDAHWGNGQIEIVHDGVEFGRFEKIEALADWDVAMEHLRVCYDPDRDGLNCGHCQKCLWAMVVLDSLGRLQAARTFPDKIDLDALRQYPPHEAHARIRFVKAIAHLEASGDNPELLALLSELLDRGDRENAALHARKPWWRLDRLRGMFGKAHRP